MSEAAFRSLQPALPVDLSQALRRLSTSVKVPIRRMSHEMGPNFPTILNRSDSSFSSLTKSYVVCQRCCQFSVGMATSYRQVCYW